METLRSGPNSGFSRSFQLRHFTASDSSKTRANARAFQQVPADTKTCWQLCQAGDARILVTAKWSVRADREEQFMSDFQAYERLESAGRDFGYVLITNEFDAARLRAACERRRQNAPLFSQVVHISPAAVGVVYREGGAEGASAVRQHIANGRLMSFRAWLESVGAGQAPAAHRPRKK